jgi:hypothetical protein
MTETSFECSLDRLGQLGTGDRFHHLRHVPAGKPIDSKGLRGLWPGRRPAACLMMTCQNVAGPSCSEN